MMNVCDIEGLKRIKAVDSLGFVFPIHSLGLPLRVIKALEALRLESAGYCYAVATMGGGVGGAFDALSRSLSRKGMVLSAAFAFKFGSNSNLFIKIPGSAPVFEPEDQEQCRNEVVSMLPHVILAIEERRDVQWGTLSLPIKGLSYFAHRAFIKRLRVFDEGYRTENCQGCGLCATHCEEGNIQLQEQRPKWLGKCVACLRCFNLCPNAAIVYGKMEDPRMHVRYRTNLQSIIETPK